MDEISVEIKKDGDPTRLQVSEAPSKVGLSKPLDANVKKKRRRGNSKRNMIKPFSMLPWQDRRTSYDKPKRTNRFRKIALSKTHAPFNNNQFLMEIHKPEPENAFQMRTPSARTRDSSFSVDSEDNYFYSLPEDEEEYLTKEFSSVYEDAQSERLSNMSKNELIQEYLLLEAKYDTLVKRTERSKPKPVEDDGATDKETSLTDKESMLTDKDTSGTSIESNAIEPSYTDLLQHLKEQEDQIRELQLTNEKLRLENEHMHQKSQTSSSEDSESDSSSTSDSDTSSSDNNVDIDEVPQNQSVEASVQNGVHINGQNAETDDLDIEPPLVNGFHSPN